MRRLAVLCVMLCASSGCGGSGAGTPISSPPPATEGDSPLSGTVAYTTVRCALDGTRIQVSAELCIGRGESFAPGAPTLASGACRNGRDVLVRAYQAPWVDNAHAAELCRVSGEAGTMIYAATLSPFPLLSIDEDGERIVYTARDSRLLRLESSQLMPAAQAGTFVVEADGTGERRVAESAIGLDPFAAEGYLFSGFAGGQISADGTRSVLAHRSPSPAPGEDDIQIYVLDLESGALQQITHLPVVPTLGMIANNPPTCCPSFASAAGDVVLFFSTLGVEGSPAPRRVGFRVPADGSQSAEPLPVLPTEVGPAGNPAEVFVITGGPPAAVGAPSGSGAPIPCEEGIIEFTALLGEGNPFNLWDTGVRDFLSKTRELFLLRGESLLQLTSAGRPDTAFVGGTIGLGERVYFNASDASGVCQLFSMDPLSSEARRITDFTSHGTARTGCLAFLYTGGCGGDCWMTSPGQDQETGTLLTVGNCNPEGGPPIAPSYLAVAPDGSGARVLLQGRVERDANGHIVLVEVPVATYSTPIGPAGAFVTE